jgi:CheY-like chemotaxis protein
MTTAPSASSPPAVLLYIEDEENDVLFLRRAFSRAGAVVELHALCDGEKAIAFLANQPPYEGRPAPRLIVLDLNLPARSGFEVLEWVRGQPALQAVPVVILSSSGRPEDRRRAETLGVSDYFLKPTSSARLGQIAQTLWTRWLAPSPPAPPPPASP